MDTTDKAVATICVCAGIRQRKCVCTYLCKRDGGRDRFISLPSAAEGGICISSNVDENWTSIGPAFMAESCKTTCNHKCPRNLTEGICGNFKEV